MASTMNLLYPEWQCCKHSKVHRSALWLAKTLFADEDFVLVEAPEREILLRKAGVNGLESIASRFEVARTILSTSQPDHLFMIGGTCGAELAPVSYLNSLYSSDIAIIWFDAHGDLNTPESSPSGDFHGMILRTLLGDGPAEICQHILRPLTSSQVFLVGARDLDKPEFDYVQKNSMVHIEQIEETSCGRLVDAITSAGYRRVYIHLDVDVLNPKSFADALMPTPGGPTLEELGATLSLLNENFDVVGMSIVEYAGESDSSRRQIIGLLEKSGLTLR